MPHAVDVAALLALAGVVAGIIGTAGGITTLVAYGALLALGIPPLTANVTTSVALLGSGFSSATRATPDIVGQGSTIRRWLPLFVLFSVAGAVLLVATPGRIFDRIVPYLVAAAAATLLLQPRISRWQDDNRHTWSRAGVTAGISGVALYNGYFGAGSGIMLIALLLLTVEPVLYRANAMKNVIIFCSDVLPAALFAALGSVDWGVAIPLGFGAVGGGFIGPLIARHTRHDILRVLIACCGFALAGWLLLNP